MDHVQWDERPQLRHPVMIAAFEGWNDAAEAASTAARYLRDRWGARPFASIDPEEFYDFTETRPEVRLRDGVTRSIQWPTTQLSSASVRGTDRDVVVLLGTEPQLKWRTFCTELVGVACELEVELVISLGALLANVAHTRPVRVTGTAATTELISRLGLERSAYEGPTGIVGVLHDSFARAKVPSASLWASVPHYVGATPSPKAALALVERAAGLVEAPVITADLAQLAADYERQVTEVVDEDSDVAGYVRRLEEDADAEGLELASGDELADELQRFLREQDRE